MKGYPSTTPLPMFTTTLSVPEATRPATRSGANALVTAIGPKTLTSNMARTRSKSASMSGERPATPALLTSTSRRPASASIVATAAAIESADVTSSATTLSQW